MTKTLAFLFQATLELFKTEKFFKLKQNYDLQPYLKFLQKKLKNWFFAFFCDFLQNFHFFSKIFFFQFFFEKFISFYFLEFLSDFGANTLKMSEFCYTFQKNLKQRNSLSFSHQNKQISMLVYFFRFSKKIQLDFSF